MVSVKVVAVVVVVVDDNTKTYLCPFIVGIGVCGGD